MKKTLTIVATLLVGILLSNCSNYPDAPELTLTSIDGTSFELNDKTPVTALFFFSMNNPVAIGAFNSFPGQLDDAADSFAIAMYADRPPNVAYIQQHTLVPIVIDETNNIAKAFGGIDLTPALILVSKGKILLHQRGQIDYVAVNAMIHKQL